MESELVSGFMTEHAAVVFVFFFLAEYGSIVLMCILTSILFLGGYLSINSLDVFNFIYSIFFNIGFIDFNFFNIFYYFYKETFVNNSIIEGLIYGLTIGLKSSILIFLFIWCRASFPRIRFDQLMSFCWIVLLPILFAFIVVLPCMLYSYNIFPLNIYLL